MKKTLAAALFTTFNFLLTAVSLAYVHEIHPEGTEPLPDQFLDRITYQVGKICFPLTLERPILLSVRFFIFITL